MYTQRWIILLTLAATALPLNTAHALPAWARKYNMNCDGCHSPAVPRLNAKGFAFKWAGYRMPDEIGEDQEIKNVSDYLAARAQFQYQYGKTQTQSADVNSFVLDNATLFAGGALGKHYGAMFEYAHSDDGNDLMVNMIGVWGKASQFVGVRGGEIHWLNEGSVAGFDRPTGINFPTPIGGPTTLAVPFQYDSKGLGVEAFYVAGRNRLSFEVLNSMSPTGETSGSGAPTTKDFVAIDQFIYDTRGSGVTVASYFGSIRGLDTTVTISGTSHYTRVALTANKILGGAEVLGGYVYSKDNDLPVGGIFTQSTMTGSAYWVYGGYTFPSALTVFSRYEFVNPNTDSTRAGGAASTRFVLGGVLPVSLPQYLRLAAEYTLDTPHVTDGLRRNEFTAEVMFAF